MPVEFGERVEMGLVRTETQEQVRAERTEVHRERGTEGDPHCPLSSSSSLAL